MKKLERLAGYISGASVDLVRVASADGNLLLSDHRRFVSRDFSSFDAILKLYLKSGKSTFDGACFGVAGPVINNEVIPTNLPWHLHGESIANDFPFPRVKLFNDIVATAHGLKQLGSDKFFTINKGEPDQRGNIGLIAAGFGLGEALIYDDGQRIYPWASEGGHSDFAPGSQLEVELWQYLYAELGHVEVEDVVSLRGLERIFCFLIETHGGQRPDWFEQADDKPAAIIERALSGNDETATSTLDIFIDCYASEAANLALKGMTMGGIYCAGRIAPQIITALDRGRFMERFVKKGRMESLLARMPVGVIIEEKAALLGAAAVSLTI